MVIFWSECPSDFLFCFFVLDLLLVAECTLLLPVWNVRDGAYSEQTT